MFVFNIPWPTRLWSQELCCSLSGASLVNLPLICFGDHAQVLKINKRDEVLTLSSGGCNSLNLLLHGAGHVVSVDCNPAQSALLELKATAIRSLPPAASVQAPSSCVVWPLYQTYRALLSGSFDMPLLCYNGLRLPHVLSNFSSTSKAYQLSAAASHNSQMLILPWSIGLGDLLHLAKLCFQLLACGYLTAQGNIEYDPT